MPALVKHSCCLRQIAEVPLPLQKHAHLSKLALIFSKVFFAINFTLYVFINITGFIQRCKML